jgi:hypothetical protein
MTRIVTYVHGKKAQAAAIEGPAIVTVTDRKRLRALREEREAGSEASPELKAFFKRMMRP